VRQRLREDALKGLGNDAPYWRALWDGQLALPMCPTCKTWRWPAPFRCSDCGGWNFDWRAVEIKGEIYSWTRTWHAFDGAQALKKPYVTVSVALPHASGIRLFGLLEPGDHAKIGAPVVGETRKTQAFGRDLPVLSWRLA
jgi:uncharacterized OB-fold protein